MPLRSFSLLLFVLLVLSQTGLALWRYLPIEPSTAPVFSYPAAAEEFDNPGDLAKVIDFYQADRGAELHINCSDSTSLTVFYFEWDIFKIAPVMATNGHAPEVCNVASGAKLLEIARERSFVQPGQPPLLFDATVFSDRAGKIFYLFKGIWAQGRGSLPVRGQELDRTTRIRNSFVRHIGATRVLQAAVFDARDANHAWQTFQREVLEKLEWR